MKRKIRLIDKIHNKVIENEITLRNIDHFEVQKTTRAHIFKPKKGKGSFKRNKIVEETE